MSHGTLGALQPHMGKQTQCITVELWCQRAWCQVSVHGVCQARPHVEDE